MSKPDFDTVKIHTKNQYLLWKNARGIADDNSLSLWGIKFEAEIAKLEIPIQKDQGLIFLIQVLKIKLASLYKL